MNQTFEERAKVLDAWAASTAYPANLPKDPLQWTKESYDNFAWRLRQIPVLTQENLTALVAEMIAFKQLKTIEPEIPTDVMPWADTPILQPFQTIEDFSKEKIATFLRGSAQNQNTYQNPKDYHDLQNKFSDRHTWIVKHGVHKPVEETIKAVEDSNLIEARNLISNLSSKDIGWSASDPKAGKFELVKSIQNRLRASFIKMQQQRLKPSVILERLREELDKSCGSSVR